MDSRRSVAGEAPDNREAPQKVEAAPGLTVRVGGPLLANWRGIWPGAYPLIVTPDDLRKGDGQDQRSL